MRYGGVVDECRMRSVLLGCLVALASACGDDKGDTGPCLPGYGTLDLTYVPEDAYTESVQEYYTAGYDLKIFVPKEPDSGCGGSSSDSALDIARVDSGLELEERYQVPVGWVCGYLRGRRNHPDDSDTIVACYGNTDPVWVDECSLLEVELSIHCREEYWEGARQPPPEGTWERGRLAPNLDLGAKRRSP